MLERRGLKWKEYLQTELVGGAWYQTCVARYSGCAVIVLSTTWAFVLDLKTSEDLNNQHN